MDRSRLPNCAQVLQNLNPVTEGGEISHKALRGAEIRLGTHGERRMESDQGSGFQGGEYCLGSSNAIAYDLPARARFSSMLHLERALHLHRHGQPHGMARRRQRNGHTTQRLRHPETLLPPRRSTLSRTLADRSRKRFGAKLFSGHFEEDRGRMVH